MKKGDARNEAPILRRIEHAGSVQMTSSYWANEIGATLLALFNTHRGSAPTREDFGLPEFHPDEMSASSRLQYKANEMKDLIERFEPRLTRLKVEARIDSEYAGRAIFEIYGLLDDSVSAERVSYHTVMTGQGRVWLRK